MDQTVFPGRMASIERGDPRVIRGWVMYDWANSAYQLTITSSLFQVYYDEITKNNSFFPFNLFGIHVANTVLYSWTLAAAFLIVALFSPLLSSIADYTGRRKAFMKVFTWVGALGCGMLLFFDKTHVGLGVIAFGIGTLGYAGSIVFYNSFLPVIAEPADQDRVSARGYSMGYLGSVILLVINISMLLLAKFYGNPEYEDLAFRISFFSVFLWWLGFSQITFRRLPKYTYRREGARGNIIFKGYKELRTVFYFARRSFVLSSFLAGFFFMMMGVLTVMYMAISFGKKDLDLSMEFLIAVVLLLQFVGIAGAWTFARLSGRFGNFKALMLAVAIWIGVCFGAYTIHGASGFLIAALFIGFVMGGCQSLARSTYSKLLPETTDHTSFFSFYDVMEKLSMVLGLFMFGLMEHVTKNMRAGILMIAVFFVISLVFFLLLSRKFLKSAEIS